MIETRIQPTTNIFIDPKASQAYNGGRGFANSRWFGGSGATGVYSIVTGATDGPAGITSYKRKTWSAFVAGSSNPADCGFDITTTILPGGTPGSPITVGCWMRTSATGKVARFTVYHMQADRTTTTGGRFFGPNVPMTANQWTWVSMSYIAPADHPLSVFLRPTPDTSSTSTDWVAGDTLDITGMVIVEGLTTLPTAVDGDTPGWRWLGATDASGSVGYPYTLESIAGAPDFVQSVAGVSSNLATASNLSGRSLYVVGDVITTASSFPGWGVLQASAGISSGSMTLSPQGVGQTTFQSRVDTSGGAVGTTNAISTRSIGRHALAMVLNEGMTTMETSKANVTTVTRAITPGAGMLSPVRLTLGATTVNDAPLIAYVWLGYHDEITRRRVLGWLGRRYGASIPVGF